MPKSDQTEEISSSNRVVAVFSSSIQFDSVAVFISERKNKPGQYVFSKIELKYAYSQILLDEIIKKHCDFNILGGKATGTYRH